jgi:uncharacterized protein (TIGR02217 family)
MAFHDVQLPADVERGAQGGPMFKTTILVLGGGNEKRNIDWADSRGEWDIGYGIQEKADFDVVLNFFYARRGMAHTFRFKDWADFEITSQTMFTTDGSTSTFNMFKRYSSGGFTFDRPITKPLGSGWTILVNSIAQTVVYDTAPAASEVAITTLTGLVTLGSTHAATSGQDVVLTGEFDVGVRFDTDKLDISIETFDAGAIPQIPVREVNVSSE